MGCNSKLVKRNKINRYRLSRRLRNHARQLMLLAMRLDKQPTPSDERIFSNLRSYKQQIDKMMEEELCEFIAQSVGSGKTPKK